LEEEMRSVPRPHHPAGSSTCCCSIAPPFLLARLIQEGTPEQRDAALQTIAASASMRSRRALVGRIARDMPEVRSLAFAQPPAAGAEAGATRQSVYDVEEGGNSSLPGTLIRAGGDPPAADPAVNEVYDATETTHDFYRDIFKRDSIDGEGMELISSVHYSAHFNNAMWNGAQMVYGDGDGHFLQVGSLTKALDVIAHELTHGVTERTAGLEYSYQPGALNEHNSDVVGSLVKQYHLKQEAAEADWLIGEGVLAPSLGAALRSMKEPGTAMEGDPQPAHMSEYVDLPDDGLPEHDNGGVHINSGIPNRAFYLAATSIGGSAWEKAGQIWYRTLTGGYLNPDSEFKDAANATVGVAEELYGEGSEERAAVEDAWQQVGVLP
jgi:Zn-dependent metalloprotease